MLSHLNNNYNTKISDTIFNISPVAIFVVDHEGIIKSTNNSAVKLFNLSVEELQKQSILELFPKIDSIFPKKWWQKLYYPKKQEMNLQVTNQIGITTPIKIFMHRYVEHDKHIIFACPILDFTPTENSILQSENRLDAMYNSCSDLIAIINAESTILSFNNAFKKFVETVFGMKTNEGDAILNYIPDSYKKEFTINFDAALKGHEINEDVELFYEELTIWWKITFTPIRNNLDEISGIALIFNHIDERKIAEIALRKREERFELIIAGTKDGWWDWDLKLNILMCSERWWNKLGYASNELVNISKYWEKIVHPEDLNYSRNKFNEAINSNQKTFEYEFRAKHKDGHFIPMLSRGFIVREEDGKAIRVSGSDMDLTETKRVEHLLLESQRKINILHEIAAIGCYEIDIVNFKFNASPLALDILGIDENFIQDVSDFKKLLYANDLEKVQFYYQKKQTDPSVYTAEYRIINQKNGDIKWLSDYSKIEYNALGKPQRVIGGIQDITERKNIEKSTQYNETKYQSLIENMDLGILEVDNNEMITKAYPKFCELVGYTESELLGKSAVDLFLPKSNLSEFEHAIEGRKNGTSNAYEIKILNKKQETIDVIISGTPLFDDSGSVVGSVGIHYNISEHKKTTQELKKSFDLVSEQNKRLLNFSYIVSHNLRSHSSNITSLLNILSTTEKESEKEVILNHLNSVSKLLNETLSNLNDVVSIQNNIDVIVEPINIYNQIEKILILLNDQIETKKAQINIDVDSKLTINFNPAYFDSILYNLISNALKYCKPNKPSVIKISCKTINGKLVLSIADNGIGIDLEKNGSKLFGMYKTFNGNEDARGIGLFITKDQIESMGGKIEVESKLGVGTTFSVYFK